MKMTDSSNGPEVQEPARESGDARLVATAADSDGGGILRLTQEKEVVRNG
jgi:hypothetical protein